MFCYIALFLFSKIALLYVTSWEILLYSQNLRFLQGSAGYLLTYFVIQLNKILIKRNIKWFCDYDCTSPLKNA